MRTESNKKASVKDDDVGICLLISFILHFARCRQHLLFVELSPQAKLDPSVDPIGKETSRGKTSETSSRLVSSQGVLIGQTLYLSGSIGLDPKTGQFAGESVQDQTRQVD